VDDGPGISASELSRVFDRYYRGSSGRGASPGSGLGLTIARTIVETYGGDIRIGSNVSLTNVKFECNSIDLDAEDGGLSGCPNHPSSFDDKGGNVCGCDGANVACQVKSLNLDPPDPVPQP